MSRYPNASWEVRQMLTRIEADHPELVGEYLNHIGANELLIPVPREDDARKYRVWELWDDLDAGTQYWYKTDTPADKAGYISAMTRKMRFDAEEPPVPGAKTKSKAKSNDNGNS